MNKTEVDNELDPDEECHKVSTLFEFGLLRLNKLLC